MKNFFYSAEFVFLFLVLILIFWAAGFWLSLYYVFWWYDVIAHFLGGVWVASAVFVLKKRFGLEFFGEYAGAALFIAVLGIVVLAGTLWEFSEFVLDRYVFRLGFTLLPNVFEDTLSDLFMDIVGGALAFWLYRRNA